MLLADQSGGVSLESVVSRISPSTDCAKPSIRPRCKSFKSAHCSCETLEKGHKVGLGPEMGRGNPSPVASQKASICKNLAARSEFSAVNALLFPEIT